MAAPHKPTGKTITHKGRAFHIHTTEEPEHKADAPYVLVPASGRGSSFILTRNRPNPAMLFGIAWAGCKTLPGWFTDKTGELVSLG